MSERHVGIDIGAESLKIVELTRGAAGWACTRRVLVEHRKEPLARLREVLDGLDWRRVSGAAVTGRFAGVVRLPRVPFRHALSRGAVFVFGEEPLTVVSIGSRGFAVLERRASGTEVFRENARCSQGTGNFLRQLVERFGLTIDGASRLCATVADPAPLSGRCPVILKTDMTHLANRGEDRARILAGLFDAVAENVEVLIKPRVSPPAVVLIGGVARSPRIRAHLARFLARHDMRLREAADDDALFCEALGAALEASERPAPPPPLDALAAGPAPATFERLPPLAGALSRVRRLDAEPVGPLPGVTHRLLLGFDIGSTGSKAVAIDADSRRIVWQGYRSTSGQPVAAAQALADEFLRGAAGGLPVIGLGATGSGREIVGSVLATCYGTDRVFILNEIAAHAAGALHYDGRVDTIFEIGGQDAKYIRLADGRVVDAAMNEACSAGTGSFIEEQGRRFAGIGSVVELAEEALGAGGAVSLGQHCSVFMAEVIDAAVAAGVPRPHVIAGIYESVVQNYLNRVKGSRGIGRVVFCQGMPFASPALAAAVARQTGSEVIVPPHPGTVGALGIALLAGGGLDLATAPPLDLRRFLAARVESQDTVVCQSTRGCGEPGNRCRIARLRTLVDGERRRFVWGGACSLYDRGTGGRKLPDRAPDPFRQREALVDTLLAGLPRNAGALTVALTDEFMLKGLFPFFATFLSTLGLALRVRRGGDQRALKRGIEEANVPFCAPMQQFHGLVAAMADDSPDFLFLPRVRSLPRTGPEPNAVTCPIVQGAPDVVGWDLPEAVRNRVVAPVVDIGRAGLDSPEFRESCRRVAAAFGVHRRWAMAMQAGVRAQQEFTDACAALGRAALDFCAARGVVPVVVLGRPYTVYNTVLNSNVPALLREQGALPIPIDCYPLDAGSPAVDQVYWAHGQRNLRAAHQIRRAPGVYSVFCSNYSCGPDSFVLHFYAHVMAGKPFAVIETDGHAGDAGTKTRIEAFLHCVREDLARRQPTAAAAADLRGLAARNASLAVVRARGDTLLLPHLTDGSEAAAAILRGLGFRAEALGVPDREALALGRQHTSGKECVPLQLTLGRILQRVRQEPDPDRRFVVLMPRTTGPCRFGLYNLLETLALERAGLGDRVRMWSPVDHEYFADVGPGIGGLAVAAVVTHDALAQGLFDARPVETRPGAAQEIYDRFRHELYAHLEAVAHAGVTPRRAVVEAATGRLFGCAALLERAAAAYAAVKGTRRLPTVAVVGEIYVRCDPFACDGIIDKLEARGLRVRFSGVGEWLEYIADLGLRRSRGLAAGARLSHYVQRRCHDRAWAIMARALGWPPRTPAREAVAAASSYLRPSLEGEAVLTLGAPLAEWRHGHIDGVVSVGPLECMPNKIAEAQFFHVSEREGLPALTVPLHGDPMDPDPLDHFAYDVHRRFARRAAAGVA